MLLMLVSHAAYAGESCLHSCLLILIFAIRLFLRALCLLILNVVITGNEF